ncbi:AzlD domain-containing protein [Prosthecomicrobium sp. N25]|uniref:AzlD domain-containing protein n=1 Tax=Prosthecomicrobium sp. N25 TaxID=3129254 RepID=UPI003077F29D
MSLPDNPLTWTYHSLDTWWWPTVFILLAGFVPNDLWRALGVVFAGRLREDSEIFAYVKAVATAIVAGVVAQLVFFPSGSLALSPLWLRLLAVASGFAAFKLARNRVLVGVLAGEAVLILLWVLVVGVPDRPV